MGGTPTTMDNLAVGALFSFSENTKEPRYEKVSNLYAKDLHDKMVRPNATNATEAASIVVYYFGSSKSQAAT